MVRGSQVALKHVIHDMEARTLVMQLRRRAITHITPANKDIYGIEGYTHHCVIRKRAGLEVGFHFI